MCDLSGSRARHRQHKKDLIAKRIRQISVKRVIWGSDGAFGGRMTPAQALQACRELPLTPQKFRTTETNITPYMR